MKKAKPKTGYVVVIKDSRDMIGPVHFTRTKARDYHKSFGKAVRLAKVRISEVRG